MDSYAWIEYFAGSAKGKSATKYVESSGPATPTVVIAELSRKLLGETLAGRETVAGRLERLRFVRSSTVVLDLTDEVAVVAGEIDVERKEKVRDWGLADSIVLATARESGAKVVTGDKHFNDLGAEIVFLA
ncbi:MAG: PIN domain-containing protein [Thaumarchaeota archaeon]|nr:PIN domain-containing protein [Nitrososphaerota archaeon]